MLGESDINIKQMAELKWISNPGLHPFADCYKFSDNIEMLLLNNIFLDIELFTIYYINNHYMRYVLVLL